MKIKELKIGDICNFIGGSQPPKELFSKKKLKDYVRLIQIRDYKTDQYLTYIPKDSTNKFCDCSDIMIGRYGPPIFQIFRGLEGAYNVALIKAIPNKKIEKNYLYYFLTQKHIFDYVDKLSPRTGGQTGVDLQMLKKYPINLPEYSHQKNISKTLTSLDKKIEINNQIKKRTEEMIQLIYDYWFLNFEFPDIDGKPYKSSGGSMQYNEVLKKEIPEGWCLGSLNDLASINGGATPSKSNSSFYSKNNIPWLTPSDMSLNKGSKFISRGSLDVSDKGVKAANLEIYPKDSLVLTSRAPVGYIAITNNPTTTNQGFKSFIPNKKYTIHYIYYAVSGAMKNILNFSSGSTFKEISGTHLKSVPVYIPPYSLTEQFSNKVKNMFELQRNCELENEKLVKIKEWLLPVLMNKEIKFELYR